MTKTTQKTVQHHILVGTLSGLSFALSLLTVLPRESSPAPIVAMTMQQAQPNTHQTRFQTRLRKQYGFAPSSEILNRALTQRMELLQRSVVVSFVTGSAEHTVPDWALHLQDFPEFLGLDLFLNSANYRIDGHAIAEYLRDHPPAGAQPPEDAVLVSMTESDGVTRADVSGQPRGGFRFDHDEVARQIVAALNANEPTLSLQLTYEEGKIHTIVDGEEHILTLLGRGRSDFSGSPAGRAANIRKAMREHINGVIVAPDAAFSFNGTLGGPITNSRGWRDALAIFEGENLRLVPGGGICQAATTTYRAMVNAGLPVLERKNHSLYVHYYEKHGVGIDATVFYKRPDLKFQNDTGNTIVILARAEGNEAFVEFYGVPDGRTVALSGPYFTDTAPEDVLVNGRKLYRNEIVWRQQVVMPDGNAMENLIVSRYKQLPKKLYQAYAPVTVSMHAAAGL